MTIASLLQQGCTVRHAALRLQPSPSTISRELRRNTCGAVGYANAPPMRPVSSDACLQFQQQREARGDPWVAA